MRRPLPFLASAALFVAACGSSDGTSSPTASANASGAREASTTVAPTTLVPTTPTPTTTTVAAPAVADRGTFAVGERTETYVDASRPTDANNDFAGAPDRTIETVMWYPARGTASDGASTPDAALDTDSGPYPLILLSHGWTANAQVYQLIARTWASAGYVVAAPNYPLSTTTAPGGPIVGDVENQPADASFVIDQVLADAELGEVIDADRIGAAGHSLGGITTFALVYAECCTDDRIDAAIPMSGIAGIAANPSTYFGGTAIPLLILHGDEDELVPYRLGEDAYSDAAAPKLFVTFEGGNHIWPYIGGTEDARRLAYQDLTTAFFDYYLKDDPTGLDRVRAAVESSDPPANLQEDTPLRRTLSSQLPILVVDCSMFVR